MKIRNSMPSFWPKLVAQGLFIGALASGCAAGGGSLEGEAGDDFGAPSAPTGPRAPDAPSTSGPSTNSPSTPPAPSSDSSTAGDSDPVPSAPSPSADNETLPPPARDEGALPPDGDDAPPSNPPPPNAGDDDDDDRDRDRDNDSDSDSDGDDDGDDDDDRDDDDDDGDNGGDAPPPPPVNPPPVNPPPGNPPPDAVTFTNDIRPILIAECGRCHASGGLPQFASANPATGYAAAFRERNEIISEIRSGGMPEDTCDGPPGSNGCVSVADFQLIQRWVAAGAPE